MSTAVVVTIFTVVRNRLSVLLIERSEKPFQGIWALPGGLLQPGETLDDAATRKLQEETGLQDVFLEQLYTFDTLAQTKTETTVAYFALIHDADAKLRQELEWKPEWFPLSTLKALAFDNQIILENAKDRLRSKLEYTNIAYSVLPESFTLSEMQHVYEAITEEPLDKRNFRKKIVSLGIVQETGRLKKQGAHRPAKLYKFMNRTQTVI